MNQVDSLSNNSNFLLAALIAAGVAALAIVNKVATKLVEHAHPPMGKFIEINGVRLHYTDIGKGPPVLLIHGNSVSGNDWNISGVAQLLEATHRVIIFDRPGCGYSERPRGKAWTAEQQAKLLHDACNFLEIKRPILVGHSFGTIVALAYAAKYHKDTAALVLISGYYFWTIRPDVIMAALGALPVIGDVLRYTTTPLLSWLNLPIFKRMMFSPAKVTESFETSFSPAMAFRPSQIRATSVDGILMFSAVVRLSKTYKSLMMPVTILAGSGDKIVFKKNSERLQKRIPGSVIRIIDDSGHMLHHSYPDQVVLAVHETTNTLIQHAAA